MADIDVVPSKRSTTVWVWIIVAIVLALIVLAATGVFSGDSTTTTRELNGPAIFSRPAPPDIV